jgi:sulfite exporter TauE/SafE
MTPLEFSLVLSLGLVSGLHCLGMCGPIVLAYGLPLAKGQRLRAHLSYHAGRVLTYMLLGALAGAAGGALGLLGRLAGLTTGARIFAGAAMILAGLLLAGLLPSSGPARIGSRFSRVAGRLLRPGSANKFALGLVLGFLPCGLVYAALLKAVESAGALDGALTMLAFGLGTAAALLSMGAISSLAGAWLGRWSNRIAPGFIVLAGAILLWRGLTAPGAPLCHAGF